MRPAIDSDPTHLAGDLPRYLRWFRGLCAVMFIAIAMALISEQFVLLLGGVLVLVPLEHYFKRHPMGFFRPQWTTDFLHMWVGPLLVLVPTIYIARAVEPLHYAPVADAIASQPLVLQIFEAFLLRELLFYWYHRLAHQVPLLWRFHSVHHSIEHLDWLAGERGHPLEAIGTAVYVAVILGLTGFDAVELGLLGLVSTVWDRTLHANLNWRLKWLDRFWVTPEYHHWHHQKQREIHDNNYALTIPLWDIVFSTYYMPKDSRPSDYGIQDEMPMSYLGQLWHPFLPRTTQSKMLSAKPSDELTAIESRHNFEHSIELETARLN